MLSGSPAWLLADRRQSWLAGAAFAAAAVAACTALIYPIKSIAPVDSLGVLYVPAVFVVAAQWGAHLGIVTALVSGAAFDFFHLAPALSFAIEDSGDVMTLVAFLVAALIAGMVAPLTEQLRVESALRRRDAESRARVLAAADEERRRVVRDLHDGAQQRLVHAVISLKLALRAMRAGDPGAEALVGEALVHAEGATAEVRELAHGILPSVLTRGGLQAGIATLAARAPLPVTVDVRVGRVAPAIESNVYFIVAEALTNVFKHSGADAAHVGAWTDDGTLRVEVRDDGVGGALPQAGTGLLGLADRVAAMDGRLDIASPPGGGTVLRVTVPLGAAQ